MGGGGGANLGESGEGSGRSHVVQSAVTRLEANSKAKRRVHLASGLIHKTDKIIIAASSKAYRFKMRK